MCQVVSYPPPGDVPSSELLHPKQRTNTSPFHRHLVYEVYNVCSCYNIRHIDIVHYKFSTRMTSLVFILQITYLTLTLITGLTNKVSDITIYRRYGGNDKCVSVEMLSTSVKRQKSITRILPNV